MYRTSFAALTLSHVAFSGLCLAALPSAFAEPLSTSQKDQTSLAVTIYNSNLALVKDQRQIAIPRGEQQLEYRDVSGLIQPETALLRNTQDADAISVLEQNFDFDLLSPSKLLEKYLGKTLQIATTNPATGEETIESAKVLATNNGLIVQIGERIETNPQGRFIFASLPENLRATPTLTTLVNNNKSGIETYELSYLTGGLNWKADYVAEITSDNRIDLASWVTLTNRSNVEYRDANVQLVAGDVNRVQPPQADFRRAKLAMAEMAASPRAQSEDLLEYKLYSLPRKTTIANAQTKQVSLFNAHDVEVTRELIFKTANGHYTQRHSAEQKLKADVELQLTNDKASNLGMPLPKGIVRVYQKDSKGNAQFVGEDAIDHTAENDDIRLILGQSFDVTAKRTQMSYEKLGSSTYKTSYKIIFNNAKGEDQRVVLKEQFWGDWKVTKTSAKYEKTSSASAEWDLVIPAKGKKELTFTVITKH